MAQAPITPGRPDAVGSPAPIVVESYDRVALPPPGTVGRLVCMPGAGRRPGRLWMDDGACWSAAVDQAVDARAYGAVGDADTHQERDDTHAIQDALDTGQNVYLPRGPTGSRTRRCASTTHRRSSGTPKAPMGSARNCW